MLLEQLDRLSVIDYGRPSTDHIIQVTHNYSDGVRSPLIMLFVVYIIKLHAALTN